MKYTFRFARPYDADRIAEIEGICFPPDQAASKSAICQRIETFPTHFILLEADNTVIGFINGAIIQKRYIEDEMYASVASHNEQNPYQSVFGLDVLPNYRRQGLAHSLMNQLITQARQEKRRGVTLTCLKEKIGFYESMGFHSEGISESSHGGVIWYNMFLDL